MPSTAGGLQDPAVVPGQEHFDRSVPMPSIFWLSPLIIKYILDQREPLRKPPHFNHWFYHLLPISLRACRVTFAFPFSCLWKREKNSFLHASTPHIPIQQSTVPTPARECRLPATRQTVKNSVVGTGHQSSDGWRQGRHHVGAASVPQCLLREEAGAFSCNRTFGKGLQPFFYSWRL